MATSQKRKESEAQFTIKRRKLEKDLQHSKTRVEIKQELIDMEKKDPGEVEEKLEEFSERITKVEDKVSEIEEATKRSFQDYLKYIELVSQNIYFDTSIGNQLNRLEEFTTGETSLFDSVFDRIQKKSRVHTQIDSLQLPVVTLPLTSQIETVIRLSKKWDIPFEEAGSYLVDKLGKEEAERLVGKENITRHYGKKAATVWESLLKKAK